MSINLYPGHELKPPRKLTLSEWSPDNYYLSTESSAEQGRFVPYPFQKGIMDAITDPRFERVSVMKSARVGWTKIMNATVGYYMAEDPCAMMVVQPTLDDARGYSKEELSTMLRDSPRLAALFEGGAKYKDARNTILQKSFPGGSVSVVGANSGSGFRRVSRRIVLLDEVDGYPPSAGDDGDQIALAIRRTEHFHDRKILMGSTPLVQQTSRIYRAFLSGDQRRFYVPCPHCGHFDFLVFAESENFGHFMAWPKDTPEQAHFVCKFGCGREIAPKHKFDLVSSGQWRAKAETGNHASFHVWAAYSFSPNAHWGQLAKEFTEANKSGVEVLKTFVNTVLGEPFVEKGEAPDWEKLKGRAEEYNRSKLSSTDLTLTCGVDVQKNRLVYEVVAWDEEFRSWSVEYNDILGDPFGDEVWAELDKVLASEWFDKTIRMTAIDSGDGNRTTRIYEYVKSKPADRVMAVKGGPPTMHRLLAPPSRVEISKGGRLVGRTKLYMVGVSMIKSELYAWLNVRKKEDGSEPRGLCHFPLTHGEQYYQELTAEHLVAVVKRTGFETYEWRLLPGRENHVLDCRVYARAAAARLGVGNKSNRTRVEITDETS